MRRRIWCGRGNTTYTNNYGLYITLNILAVLLRPGWIGCLPASSIIYRDPAYRRFGGSGSKQHGHTVGPGSTDVHPSANSRYPYPLSFSVPFRVANTYRRGFAYYHPDSAYAHALPHPDANDYPHGHRRLHE